TYAFYKFRASSFGRDARFAITFPADLEDSEDPRIRRRPGSQWILSTREWSRLFTVQHYRLFAGELEVLFSYYFGNT
ncbi:hypothetical protein FRC00_006689, partial [Tulasnella sp. 408]